jgi:hypothetical protein
MISTRVRRRIVGIAVASLLIPPPRAMSAETAPQALVKTEQPATDGEPVADIALSAGGKLRGRVTNAAGQNAAGIKVVASQGTTIMASATSDTEGRFELNNLPGGVFQLTAGQASQTCRVCSESTAPPAATHQVMLVHDRATVRGQSQYRRFFTNPVVIAGIVAAAVAIPVAIHAIQTGRNKSGS